MATGRLFLAAALTLSGLVSLPTIVHAEDSTPSESDAKHAFQGEVNSNAVFVRSRASEDAYPTMKLSKGTKVTVVGIKGQWLKIEPPEGSFAYVPKSFINLRGDGTVGRASRDAIAHAGSQLNDLAAVPLSTVHEGEDVQIIGQYNEYFKVKPPKESYLWINKQFVDPVKTLAADTSRDVTPPATDNKQDAPTPPVEPIARVNPPTTQPGTIADSSTGSPATTQPAEVNTIAEYQKLEDQYAAASAKPITDAFPPELLAGYEKVLAAEDLPSSMRSIAELHVASLKKREEIREKLVAVQDNKKKMADQQKALVAERQEIEDRIKKNDIQTYAAVGTLRPSSLQVGQGVLYRLTDPASGRTVCYVRTNDPKYGQFLGQFIGVRGPISNDPQLKSMIENPISAEPVDQTKVNQSVAAQIVPPSLLKFAPVSFAPSTQPSVAAPAPGPTDQASTNSNEPQ